MRAESISPRMTWRYDILEQKIAAARSDDRAARSAGAPAGVRRVQPNCRRLHSLGPSVFWANYRTRKFQSRGRQPHRWGGARLASDWSGTHRTQVLLAREGGDGFNSRPCAKARAALSSKCKSASETQLTKPLRAFCLRGRHISSTPACRIMLVSNRSNRRERLLLIIFVVSVVRPVISGPPIPEQLRRRMFPPRRTPPVSDCKINTVTQMPEPPGQP
jgi:hypothetical protein